jgi:ElaB/YqjD/DUF883 family membrane-anchored ribosome-binding protein
MYRKKEAQAVYNKAKEDLSKLMKNWENKPLENRIDALLAKWGVVRQAYHSHALIGEHCHHLLDEHEDILREIAEILKDPTTRRVLTDDDIDEQIDNFMTDMRDIMGALDCAFSYAARQHVQATDAECDSFGSLCTYIGAKWRSFFKLSVTPKVHLLESHAADQFRFFRNLGDFGEDPIERLHNIDNKFNRIFNNIKTFERAEASKLKRMSRDTTPEVTEVVGTITSLSKRKFSQTVVDRKSAAQKQKIAKSVDYKSAVCEKAALYLAPNQII